MLKRILNFIKKKILKKIKREFSVETFNDFKDTVLLYTLRFWYFILLLLGLYISLKQKINEYVYIDPSSNDIPPEIGILLNKSYNEITWDQIDKAKEFLKNKDLVPKQKIKSPKPIKPDRLILLESYLKIINLFLLIPLSIVIILILSRDCIRNKIKKIVNYILVPLLDEIIMPIFKKKNRKDIIFITLLIIVVRILHFIIEYIFRK